jgi:large conductance mechanosensitive channel
MLKEFKQFILRGNVVDLAVGVMVGAAFGSVVTAIVRDLMTPLIAAIVKVPDFSGLVFTIRGSRFLYGDFINALISFLMVSGTIFFFVVKPINMLVARSKKEEPVAAPSTKKCPECLGDIPVNAKRCMHCTQQVA